MRTFIARRRGRACVMLGGIGCVSRPEVVAALQRVHASTLEEVP